MKKNGKFLILLLVAGTFLNSCKTEVKTPKDPTDEINTLWTEFISHWENEDAQALSGYYTHNGRNIPPGLKTNEGRKEIEEFYQFLFSNNQSSKYFHNIISLYFTSESAVELGEFQVEWLGNDGTEWVFNGRSLTHWVKEEETWRIQTFLFNEFTGNQ